MSSLTLKQSVPRVLGSYTRQTAFGNGAGGWVGGLDLAMEKLDKIFPPLNAPQWDTRHKRSRVRPNVCTCACKIMPRVQACEHGCSLICLLCSTILSFIKIRSLIVGTFRLFCLLVHGQCHVYYIHHGEFHFQFRCLV